MQTIQKIRTFISANTYEKYILWKNYCIAHHDDKLIFLPNCTYQIILIGDIAELLQKWKRSFPHNHT